MGELVPVEKQVQNFAAFINQPSMMKQLALAVPKHVTAERLARIVLTMVRKTPELLECSRESLLGSIMECAQLGLEPGVLGQAWILPYKGEATLIVGYRGMAQLAWRSSLIASLGARNVYEGDTFDYDYGEDILRHRHNGELDPAKITHAYGFIRTVTGGRLFEVMQRSEIDAIKQRSPAGSRGKGPWATDFPEMSRKSPFRRVFKYGPASAELNRALVIDDAADRGESQGLTWVLPDDVREEKPMPISSEPQPAEKKTEDIPA